MARAHVLLLIAAVNACALAACSGRSPVTPSTAVDSARPNASTAGVSSALAQSASGVYTLSFQSGGHQVSSLPVNDGELILKAHIETLSGLPAERGSVIFEYCSYKGLPPNDITRADEAPLEACRNGTATWAHLLTMHVNESGEAAMDFGVVQIPRTVGFRFRYLGQGSGIASGTSEAANFIWVSAT